MTVNSVYTNLNEKSTIDKIKKDLKEVSGIYAIMYNETKQLYIVSHLNLAKRIFEHIFNIGSSNIHLQRAIEKYGLNNFSVYILEILFKDNENQENKKEILLYLVILEQKYLNMFNNKYNINPVAGKSRLGAKHSEASK